MIIIVSPWYGPDTTGGAETQARSLATALHAQGEQVQVWASTGRDSFHPEATAHYPAGWGMLDGIPLWRFRPAPADQRGVPLFFQQHPQLLPPLGQFAPHELRLLGSLLSSDELYTAIVQQREHQPHTRFIFLPYPFPTSFWGALLAPQHSYLLPCLHDEPYARYRTYRYLATQVQGLLCNSHAEAALALRLYGLPPERVWVAGEGIDLSPRGDGAAFRQRMGIAPDLPVLLYVGRRDASKNLDMLFSYLREYWARRGLPLRLLLIGRGELHIPAALDYTRHATAPIWDLGFRTAQEKHDAFAAADLFVLPSLLESFSIVLMEAWLQGVPALVHGDCAVTADHVQRSGGGLQFRDFGSFAAALDVLLARPDLRHTLGARGREFVLQTCDWRTVAHRTAAIVYQRQPRTELTPCPSGS